MTKNVLHTPQFTQAVTGIPYLLDGRRWNEATADPPDLMIVTVGTRHRVHTGVSQLLEDCGIVDPSLPIDAAPGVRAELLRRKHFAFRRMARTLLRTHNSVRLTFAGELHPRDSEVFAQTNAGELVRGRSEDEASMLLHLRAAGYFGDSSASPEELAQRRVVCDAAEYLDLYPPADLPQPGEATLQQLATQKHQPIALLRRELADRGGRFLRLAAGCRTERAMKNSILMKRTLRMCPRVPL